MTDSVTPEVKKTLTIMDKSTRALAKALNEVNTAVVTLAQMHSQNEALASEIDYQSSQLEGINKAIDLAQRENAAELKLRVKEDSIAVLDELLRGFSLANISTKDLAILKAGLLSAEKDNKEAIKSAVADSVNAGKLLSDAESVRLIADHEVASAKLEAGQESLESKVEFLTQSNAQLTEMLNSEREARVTTAGNTSQPVINVGTGK
jgi:hypothetical protein